MGTGHQPDSAHSCELALRAVEAARGRPGRGRAFLAWVSGVPGWALTHARPPFLQECHRGALPTCCGRGGCARGDPSPTPQCALLCAGFARCRGGIRGGASLALACWVGRSPTTDRPSLGRATGPATHRLRVRGVWAWGPVSNPTGRALASWLCALRGQHQGAPPGGVCCPGCGASVVGRSPTPDRPSLGRAAWARYPLAVGSVCWRWSPAVPGTCSRAVVRHVLCALPGLAAPGGRCCLAPILVPWLWRAACLFDVPRCPALVRRASSGPVALGAPVGFCVAAVPAHTRGIFPPSFTGRLRGARGGGPRTGLFVPAAGPCQGRGARLALRRTRSGPL